MILNRLEKPSRCSRLVSAFQKFLDRTCCKYTPRMYFTKPASWYSATAKLDAGTLLRENYLGITAGILVGYVTFFFFSAAFAHAPHIATLFACYVMMFSVFGIAFSSDFRCVLLITLPYLLASRTRWLLMMLATGLTTTGPALNFMHNSGNFRNAIACVLGQVSSNVELMGKITKAPLSLIKNQMGTMIGNLNDQLFRARNALRKIKQAVYMATKVLNSKSDWVRTMVESCGDEVAMKNQCLAFFNTLYFNCAASMKSLSFICNLLRMFAEQACKGVAGLNDICKRESGRLHSEITNMAPVSEEQLEESEESILRFMGRENISLETGGEFVDVDFGTNVSSQAEVTAMIEEKMDLMMNGLNSFKRTIAWIVTIWTLFTVIQLIVQSALYRKKWLTKPHYDNGYISPQFVEQERKAFENKRPTTLPLSFVEQWKYVTFSSLWWSKTERSSAFGSLAFLFVGVFVLILIIIADYAMYHIVLTTAPAFSEGFGKAKQDGVSNSVPDFGMSATEQTVPEIQGNSSLSEMGRGFLALANPLKEVSFSVEASICRPRASKPDDVTTILVACSIALTLLSIVLQVYALRLRHIILAWYYPDGARRRAAWLRAYIRNTRGLFSRLLHKIRSRKLQPAAGSGPPGRLKFIDRFLFTNPVITGYLAKVGFKRVFCAQCYDAGNPAKKAEFEQKFAQCPRCGLYYCKTCQTDLQGICIYCNVPINTLSMEIDFERWSSDEEYDYFYNRYYTRRKHDESQLPAKPPSLEETVRPPSMKTRPRILLKRRIKPLIGMNIGAKFRAFLKGRGAKRVDKAVTTILTSLPSIPWWKRKRSTRRRRSRRRTRLVKEDKIKYFLEKVEEEVDVEEPEEVENPFRNRGTQTYLVRLSALRCGSASAWKESLKETGDFERSYVTGSDASSIGILGAIEPSIKSVFGDSDLCVVGDAEALGDHPTGEIYEPSIESVFGDSDLRVVGDAEALGDHPIGEINELISNENDVVGRANTGVQFIGDTQLNSTGVYLSPPKSPSYDISPCGEILPGAEMLREGSFKVNSLQHETGSCGLQLDALLSPECPGPFSSLILTSMSPIQHLPKDIKVDSGNDSFPREVGRDHKDSSLGPQISDLKSLSPLHLEVARKSLDLIVTGAEGCLDPEFAHVGSVNLLESSLKEDMVDNFDNKTAELGLPSLIKSNDSPIKDPLTPTLNASASHQTSTFKKDNSQKTDSRTKLVAGLNPAIKVVNTAPSQTQIKTKGNGESSCYGTDLDLASLGSVCSTRSKENAIRHQISHLSEVNVDSTIISSPPVFANHGSVHCPIGESACCDLGAMSVDLSSLSKLSKSAESSHGLNSIHMQMQREQTTGIKTISSESTGSGCLQLIGEQFSNQSKLCTNESDLYSSKLSDCEKMGSLSKNDSGPFGYIEATSKTIGDLDSTSNMVDADLIPGVRLEDQTVTNLDLDLNRAQMHNIADLYLIEAMNSSKESTGGDRDEGSKITMKSDLSPLRNSILEGGSLDDRTNATLGADGPTRQMEMSPCSPFTTNTNIQSLSSLGLLRGDNEMGLRGGLPSEDYLNPNETSSHHLTPSCKKSESSAPSYIKPFKTQIKINKRTVASTIFQPLNTAFRRRNTTEGHKITNAHLKPPIPPDKSLQSTSQLDLESGSLVFESATGPHLSRFRPEISNESQSKVIGSTISSMTPLHDPHIPMVESTLDESMNDKFISCAKLNQSNEFSRPNKLVTPLFSGSSDSLKSDQYLESSKRFCPADDGKQKSFKPHRVSTSSKHLKNSSIKNKPKKKFFEGPTSKIGSIEEKCASLTPVNPSSQSRATSDISMISVQGKSDTRIDIEPYLGGPEAIIGKSVYSEFKLEDTGPNTLSLDDNMTKIGLQDFTSGDEVVDVETDLGIGSGYLSPRPVATTQIVPILASNDGEEEERSVQLSPEAAIIASIEAANIDPSALLNVLRGIKLNPEISAIDSISSHVSEMSEISQDNQFSVIYDHQRKPKRELMKTKGLLLSPDKTRRVFEETEDTNQISDLDVEERNSCLSTPGTLYFNDSDTIDDSLGDNVTPLDADTLHDSGELKMEEESNSPALSQTSDFRHLSESDTDAFLKFDSNIQNTGKIFSSYSSGSNSLLQTTNKEQIDDISPVLSDCKGNDTTESESASFLFPDPKLTRWNCTNNTTPSSLEGSDLLAHGSIGHMSPLRFRNSSSGLTDYDLLMNDGQISPLDSSGCD
uniref:DC_STAMP domain-containing protein n=1 Tax=Mesocestoides corti TaxID=53468 RepID=A0A5K3EJU5_MESCO